MVKRQASAITDDAFNLKKKRVSVSSSKDTGKLSYTSGNDLIACLLGDTKAEEFFATYWEKKPFILKRGDPSFYGSIVSLDVIQDILKSNELNFESDVNVCRYVDNEKELLNEDGRVKFEDLKRLMEEKKATFQFFHLQRYVDQLWNIVEKLETHFGSLVGSSLEITPEKSQGVAPHCDDVETFVLQLEGSQKWSLYKPMVELSRDYTQDLLQESIGEPTFEITLEQGDLLYFPRGVIHQCKCESGGNSIHLALTTYQQNSWGDFMNQAITQSIEKALEDEVSFRRGLPLNYGSIFGTRMDMNAYIEDGSDDKSGTVIKTSNLDSEVKDFREKVQSLFTNLVDHIDINTAADAMCAEYMASRLPPYGYVANEEIGEEKIPKLEDKIKMKYPEHVRIIYDDEEEKEDEESDEEDVEEDEELASSKEQRSKKVSDILSKSPKKDVHESIPGVGGDNNDNNDVDDNNDDDDEDADVGDIEPHIKVIHSLQNDRFAHMSGGSIFDEGTGGCIKLHVSFGKAVVEVVSSKDFIAVKDIAMDDDEDKLTLATILYANDLVEVQST